MQTDHVELPPIGASLSLTFSNGMQRTAKVLGYSNDDVLVGYPAYDGRVPNEWLPLRVLKENGYA